MDSFICVHLGHLRIRSPVTRYSWCVSGLMRAIQLRDEPMRQPCTLRLSFP
jgi:hypothetical protein